MPLLQVTSNIALSETEKSNALQTLSKTVSELLGKSEDYIMTSWTTAKMTMSGSESRLSLSSSKPAISWRGGSQNEQGNL